MKRQPRAKNGAKRVPRTAKKQRRTFLLAGERFDWPDDVPPSASVEEKGRSESSVWGDFTYRNGRAQVCWARTTDPFHAQGKVQLESYFNGDGVRHGLQLSRHRNRTVEWQVPWVRGHMHGIARQFDDEGGELYRARFARGSGVDLWLNGRNITELRVMRRNHRHGVERWGHPRLPYEESYFSKGKLAGLVRRWTGIAPEEGYPKYFVDDTEVSQAEYVRIRASRPELPRDDRRDDRRARPLHPSLRGVWLPKDVRANLMRVPRPDELIGCGAGSCSV